MSRRLAHPTRDDAALLGGTGSTTVDAASRVDVSAPVDGVRMFGDVDPEVRLRMELLARASASPETALPHVIALLVDGDERRDAIVQAITDNAPLREQWHRTWPCFAADAAAVRHVPPPHTEALPLPIPRTPQGAPDMSIARLAGYAVGYSKAMDAIASQAQDPTLVQDPARLAVFPAADVLRADRYTLTARAMQDMHREDQVLNELLRDA